MGVAVGSYDMLLLWLPLVVMAVLFFLMVIYLAVRAGALAWYRTKRQYTHRLLDELDNNGERRGKK